MSERETEPLQPDPASETAELVEDYPTGQYWEDEPDELPPRPRRRLVTPLTIALLGVLLAASGFVAGVLAEKGQSNSGSTAASAFGGRAGGGGAGGGAGSRRGAGGAAAFLGAQGGGGATTGQVSNVHGRTLYVQDDQGNTIKVSLPAGATVSRTTSSSVQAIHPGDSVIVQGTQAKDGSISASSVRATAASLGGGGALSQLFGGGQSSAAGGGSSRGGNASAGGG